MKKNINKLRKNVAGLTGAGIGLSLGAGIISKASAGTDISGTAGVGISAVAGQQGLMGSLVGAGAVMGLTKGLMPKKRKWI